MNTKDTNFEDDENDMTVMMVVVIMIMMIVVVVVMVVVVSKMIIFSQIPGCRTQFSTTVTPKATTEQDTDSVPNHP